VSKLVRDRIPEIMRREGKTPAAEEIAGERLKCALKDKLVEEALELHTADDIREELVDVLEVIDAIVDAYGLDDVELSGILTIVILLLITPYILWNGIGQISWDFLTASPVHAGREGGIFPTIVATLYITALALLVSTPLSIGGAIYIAEYAGESRMTQLVRFGADSLAGIPSIMIGLFGYLLFVSYLNLGFSLLSGEPGRGVHGAAHHPAGLRGRDQGSASVL
jgi:ABC-type phosphate transport system permease subunit